MIKDRQGEREQTIVEQIQIIHLVSRGQTAIIHCSGLN